MPPKAFTRGNVTGDTQMAGAPSWAPRIATATIAMTWASPKIECWLAPAVALAHIGRSDVGGGFVAGMADN